MIWQYCVAAISAIMFFGFVILCVCKFKLLPCYSDYGPAWAKICKLNPWCVVTTLSAMLLMPVLLEASVGSIWQFTGFLCAAFIAIVGFTPDFAEHREVLILHLICAEGGALWAFLYIMLNATRFWWIIPTYIVIGGICTLIWGKRTWNFWLEMAAYLSMYTVTFLII